MKTRLTFIAAAVAMLFSGMQPVMAMSATHESEWNKITLCDKVTVASDSAEGWGCWTDFAPPAAGPNGGSFMGAPGNELYLNNPIVNPVNPVVNTGCPDGAACGYAVYMNYDKSGGFTLDSFSKGTDTVYPATFVVNPQFGDQGWFGGDLSASFVLTPLNTPLSGSDPAPMFTESGNLDGGYVYGPVLGGVGQADRQDETGGASIAGSVDHTFITWEGWHPEFQPSAVAVGGDLTSFKIYVYVTGQSGSVEYSTYLRSPSQQGVEGAYVVGYPTTAAQMTAMNTLIGHYSGSEVLAGGNVNITAYFNNGTWNGSWDYGRRGALPNWDASGTITGGNIQSTALGGAAQSGLVQGTFYGSGAQNLAGISDVMLQQQSKGFKSEGASQLIRHTDLFVTDLKSTTPAGSVE